MSECTHMQAGSMVIYCQQCADEQAKIKHQLEWLWANCKIVYRPGGVNYAIEHNIPAHSDGREIIEGYMDG